MQIITIDHVNFKHIIKYPKIEIEENKLTFICGKSGCGKSTLLRLINASVPYDEGDIIYNGKSILDYDPILLRRDILLVSQSVFLFDNTIKENFAEFYRYRKNQPPDDEVIKRYLRLCLADFPLDINCRDMSGGERQRVFLAIGLSFLPKVLMLDEPTSALDGITARGVIIALKEYCKEKGITLIAVTHDQGIAKECGDAIITLERGTDNE